MKRLLICFLVFLSFIHFPVRAELQLPAMFSDNAVLQQGIAVPVWGWADEDEVVTVTFRDQKVTTTARLGKWSVTLKELKAGGPETLTITTRAQTLQFTNVLVGEVWLCTGQSNMVLPLGKNFEPEADIASATNSQIRLFTVPKYRSDAPATRMKSSWVISSPATAKGFSAVGYYFGRDLQKARQVPVGLIQTCWGGTPAETWMSREALALRPRFQKEILDDYTEAIKKYHEATLAYEIERAAAKKTGQKFEVRSPSQPWKPSELYQGMIAPLIPYAIKGAIWYQGEANADRAEQYRILFADLIRNWRRDWGQGDFPFICVQLAPFQAIKDLPAESAWAELREAQWLATRTLPKVGMAVITDIGDPNDIHPKKKQPVGERLALAARGIAYGEPIEYSGPLYKNMTIKDSKVILGFDHVGKGLTARNGELQGFALCGEDRKFIRAKAEIVGDTVVVCGELVTHPTAVRYGWADCPVVNLWNKDGLPASPFRTDDFPMLTAPKP